jgi:hypothetical protein
MTKKIQYVEVKRADWHRVLSCVMFFVVAVFFFYYNIVTCCGSFGFVSGMLFTIGLFLALSYEPKVERLYVRGD